MGIREKIKNTQTRLVELSLYLGVSRPTLYKYIELYEKKEYGEIDKKCFDFFTFIDNSKNLKRPSLMDYLINKVIPIEDQLSDVSIISSVRKLTDSMNELDKDKLRLIEIITQTNKFDLIVEFLLSLDDENKITLEIIQKTINEGGY